MKRLISIALLLFLFVAVHAEIYESRILCTKSRKVGTKWPEYKGVSGEVHLNIYTGLREVTLFCNGSEQKNYYIVSYGKGTLINGVYDCIEIQAVDDTGKNCIINIYSDEVFLYCWIEYSDIEFLYKMLPL